jgi:peptidoglycan hydrolase-like protein with peptidoglycan-binding domain
LKTPAPKPSPSKTPTPAPKPPAPKVPDAKTAAKTALTPYKGTALRPGARGAAVRALQRALGIRTVDGVYGAATKRTVAAFQRTRHLPATGNVGRRTWDAAEAVAYPLLPYRRTQLRQGSTGRAVTVLQRALGGSADGRFAASTTDRLRHAQRRAKLPVTGVTDLATWLAVERAAYPFGARRW